VTWIVAGLGRIYAYAVADLALSRTACQSRNLAYKSLCA
jgi:hypothetical protein